MIAVLFGTYDSNHAANGLLRGDLRRAGLTVRECHEPLWQETRDKDASFFGPAALARLGWRWIRTAIRLVRRLAAEHRDADVLVAGFNGQLDVLLARLVAGRRRVLFAPLVTVTETLVDDRARYAPDSIAARFLEALDRLCLAAADVVLIDTEAHRQYLGRRLGADLDAIHVQYLGAEALFADSDEDEAPPEADDRSLRVLGYGTYLPLHGMDVVADAAARLTPEDGIEIELIGTGPERGRYESTLGRNPFVTLTDWIPYEDLPARLRRADVALGIFGRTDKARMVIPNKVYQAAFAGRPIVTAQTPALDEVFPEGSVVPVAPDGQALVEALRALRDAPERRRGLGPRARTAALRAAGSDARAERLAGVLRTAVGGQGDAQ